MWHLGEVTIDADSLQQLLSVNPALVEYLLQEMKLMDDDADK